MRRFFGLSLVCLWPLLTGLMVSPFNESVHHPAAESTAQSADVAGTREDWLGVYQDEEKVGYVQRRLTPTNTGYDWEEHWWLSLRLPDDTSITHTEVQARADRDCALSAFSLWSVGAGAALYVKAEILNRGTARQEIRGESASDDGVTPFSVPLPMSLHFPPLCQMAVPLAARPGASRKFSVFHPLSLGAETVSLTTVGPEAIAVDGQPHTATKLAATINDTALFVWVDQEGRTLKEEIAPGVALRRESRETATSGGWQERGITPPTSTAEFLDSSKEE